MPANSDLAVQLLLQLAVIIAFARLVGFILRPLGQTQVIGEIVAGVLLGPSLLGWVAPDVQRWLFPATITLVTGTGTVTVPHPSVGLLYVLGQLGLILYMFLMGLDFNTSLISRNVKDATVISLAGIAAPLVLGGALGWMLAGEAGLFPESLQRWQAALFLSAAIAITAFPVLARIIYEMGMTQTRIGTLALGSAAMNDAIAWALLAVVLASVARSPFIAVLAIGGGLAYAAAMLGIGRRLFAAFDHATTLARGVPVSTFTLMCLVLLLGAWFTDQIGIYSVFGAFIAGTVVPRGAFAEDVRRAIERLTVVLLVPIFFVSSGLSTQLNLLTDPAVLASAAVVVAVAFLAKWGACTAATRLSGMGWRGAISIGALMNARGMMELVLINIGRERGLITPALFTILVLMTLITTMLAAPVFRLVYRPEGATSQTADSAPLTAG